MKRKKYTVEQINAILKKTKAVSNASHKARNTFFITDYTKLKQSITNRNIRPNSKLKEDIEKYGQLEPIVVRRNAEGTFDILNGYHRYFHLKELGLPIECIELPENFTGEDFDAVKSLNMVSRDWDKKDLSGYHIKTGNSNYTRFKEAVSLYSDLSATILYGHYAKEKKGNLKEMYENGTLEFDLSEEQKYELDVLDGFIRHIQTSRDISTSKLDYFNRPYIFKLLQTYYAENRDSIDISNFRGALKEYGYTINNNTKIEYFDMILEKYEDKRIATATSN